MKPERVLAELLEIARRCGIRVRRERGRFRGGYCIIGQERLIVLNRALPPEQMVCVLAEAFRCFRLDGVPMKPAVRALLEEAAAPGVHGTVVLDVSTPEASSQQGHPCGGGP